MGANFRKGQEVIYQGANDKYKGKVAEVVEKSGRSGTYYEYEVNLTHKEGLATAVNSVTASSKSQGYEKIPEETRRNISEGSLSKA